MSASVVIPSKLFLLGEYSILEGGPAFVAAIRPEHVYFTYEAPEITAHPESPLGQWLTEFARDLDRSKVPTPWHGPHPVRALQGLGSSTAELIAAWTLQRVPAQPAGLLAWYRSRFPKQSGADLAVQLQALGEGCGIYELQPDPESPGAYRVGPVPTGRAIRQLLVFKAPEERKLATHESLKSHARVGFDAFKLEFYHGKFRQLLASDELEPGWKLLTEWARDLAELGLESVFGREVRESLSRVRGVVGVKGCGAGLNDVFLAAATAGADVPALMKAAESHGLRFLGALSDLIDETDPVRAFAPVNIAWIKYMGKESGRPTNPSYSITLDEVGTLTEIELRAAGSGSRFSLHWNPVGYVPPEAGREKIEAWLRDDRLWDPLLQEQGFVPAWPSGEAWVTTYNSAPAATGIATSASSFAAFALAWSASLVPPPDRARWIERLAGADEAGARLRARLAEVASRGSGSAGRSISGPWVEWTRDHQFVPHAWDTDWIDCILLLETEPKRVSSSQAHERVRTSPHFAERMQRLPARIEAWRLALEGRDREAVRKLTLEEALDMHQLFHTSDPPFTYLNDAARRWIELAKQTDGDLPSRDFVVTLDAGSNVHWFVRPRELRLWRTWFKFKDPKLQWLEGKVGKGARYA